MSLDIDVTLITRPHLKDLETKHIESGGDPKDFKEIWLQYARLVRPKRLAQILLFLIEKAAYRETSSYKEIASLLGTDSFHENMHLIKLLGELCILNKWPKYAVLIKQEATNRVGPGFFTDYGITVNDKIRVEYERTFEVECYETPPPTAVEIFARLLEFIDKKNLGKI